MQQQWQSCSLHRFGHDACWSHGAHQQIRSLVVTDNIKQSYLSAPPVTIPELLRASGSSPLHTRAHTRMQMHSSGLMLPAFVGHSLKKEEVVVTKVTFIASLESSI